MGIFDRFRNKTDKSSDSLSLSISKDSFSGVTIVPEKDLQSDSISQEVVAKGDTLLDTYKVVSDIMKGGMGSVWKVHHKSWNTDLAMKRPQPKYFAEGSGRRKENFIHECEAWINLGLHPNIVSCYYVREIGGVPSIFSEWMENGDLERNIADGELYKGTKQEVQERLLDIAIQFARGLQYAHENNLIHQDVKPDNLLLTKDWEAKVSDFGISKARSALEIQEDEKVSGETYSNATQMSPAGGRTPAYCSPEQAAEQLLTQRTDIYSWAVSVLEMYLGEKPWARRQELTGPLVGPVCRDYFAMCRERPIPGGLQKLLIQCFAQDPADRPHDFAVIGEELTKIYKEVTGEDYPRPEPKAGANTASSLNNRALSFIDIGKPGEAKELLEKAHAQNVNQPEPVYNLALLRWRLGEISRKKAEELLQAVEDTDMREKGIKAFSAESEGVLTLEAADYHSIKYLNLPKYSADRKRCSGEFLTRSADGSSFLYRQAVCSFPDGKEIFSVKGEGRITLTPDGRSALVSRWKDEDVLYDVDSGSVLWKRENHGEQFLISDDGKWAVGMRKSKRPGQYLEDYEIDIVSMDSGKTCRKLEGYALAGLTPDGRLLLNDRSRSRYSGDDPVFLAGFPDDPLPEGKPLIEMKGSEVLELSWHPWLTLKGDKALLRCGYSRNVIVNYNTGERLGYLGPKMEGALRFAVLINKDQYLVGLWEAELKKKWSAGVWRVDTLQELLQRDLTKEEFPYEYGLLDWLENSPAPADYTPGPPAEYHLCEIRNARLQLEGESLIRQKQARAEAAAAGGDPAKALKIADEIADIPEPGALAASLQTRALCGRGLKKRGVLRLVILEEAAPPEQPRRKRPGKDDLKRWEPQIENLRRELLTRYGGDVYSEYTVQVTPREYCRDDSFVLADTVVIEERDSPAQFDIEETDWYGIAVLDADTGESVYYEEYYRKVPESNLTPLISFGALSHNGKKLLGTSGGLFLQTLDKEDPQRKRLADGIDARYWYADFLDDDRYVICQDTEKALRVIDTEDGAILSELAVENGAPGLTVIDDDRFAVKLRNSRPLGRIVWDYEV